MRPIWEKFVEMAVLSGQLKEAGDQINPLSLKKASFQGPIMPWIDPQKEANAEEKMVQSGFKSRAQVIRERGNNPQDVFEQIKQEREQETEAGISFSSSNGGQQLNLFNENQGDPDAPESSKESDDESGEETGDKQPGDSNPDD